MSLYWPKELTHRAICWKPQRNNVFSLFRIEYATRPLFLSTLPPHPYLQICLLQLQKWLNYENNSSAVEWYLHHQCKLLHMRVSFQQWEFETPKGWGSVDLNAQFTYEYSLRRSEQLKISNFFRYGLVLKKITLIFIKSGYVFTF